MKLKDFFMHNILELILNFLISPGIPKRKELRSIIILFGILFAVLLGTKLYNHFTRM